MNFNAFLKPQRYIGNETNVIKKPHQGKVKICVSYPDLYEVGMSNLGLRIVYGLLNEFNGIVCERVFMPGLDLAGFLKKNKQKLFSLETKTPLDQFEIIGFNLNYELNFTNILHILSLGGVPLKAKMRQDIIVLGGGGANPEPLTEFIDVFCLGEFEAAAPEFVQTLQKYKDKESRLKALSTQKGFYVPKFYSVTFTGRAYQWEKNFAAACLPVKKIHVPNLNDSFYPRRWLTPHTQIIHDRATVEISRGCPNRCTFCQARAQYQPYRERNVSTIQALIKEIYQTSGYENFSFLSLSASDYSAIEQIIDETLPLFQEQRIGLALPSLRIDDTLGRLYTKLLKIKKTSLTVAVETARAQLRDKLNKKIDINKLFQAAQIIRALKVKHLKVYFMFGFPQEEEQDLIAIAEFLGELSKKSKLAVNASINAFIPKPFSLWQDAQMQSEEVLNAKKDIILKHLPFRRNIKTSFSFLSRSILEAVTARADRKFSAVIYSAFSKGAAFDGYTENFSVKIWEEAMKENGIDYRFYLEAKTDNFPWSFIEIDQCQLPI